MGHEEEGGKVFTGKSSVPVVDRWVFFSAARWKNHKCKKISSNCRLYGTCHRAGTTSSSTGSTSVQFHELHTRKNQHHLWDNILLRSSEMIEPPLISSVCEHSTLLSSLVLRYKCHRKNQWRRFCRAWAINVTAAAAT